MVSKTVECALRALVELARLNSGDTILGRDLAEQSRVPKDFLAKILGRLRTAGFVASSPGTGGGYRLAKAPDEIQLMEIVLLFDGETGLPACLLQRSVPCSDETPCSAHALWKDIRSRYITFLKATTIANISETTEQKQQTPMPIPGEANQKR